jgi:glycosyltransferase involved in cell wall biosynthesis
MRILVVAPRWPFPVSRGDQLRVAGLVNALRMHAEVKVLAFRATDTGTGSGTDEGIPRTVARTAAANLRRPDPRIPGQVRMFLDGSMDRAVARELAGWRPDVVHVTLSRMAPYLPRAGPWHRHLDLVDSLSANVRRRALASGPAVRAALMIEARLLERYEARAVAAADSASLVAEADRTAAEGLERCAVVPNGIDLEAFPFRSPAARQPVLLFFGNLGYFPNVEAARFVAVEVLPRVRAHVPAARLVLAGARPAAPVRRLSAISGVEIRGDVPDMASVLHEAAVSVLPMFTGTGMKNKVLEAMSSGTPVVSNRLGIQGIEGARNGRDHLRVEGADELANVTARLLLHPHDRERLAVAGRDLVEKAFTWSARARDLLELYRRPGA